MKTFVVLAGLMVIVPHTNELGEWTSLSVMVLDVTAGGKLLGEDVHEHVTKVTNIGGTVHDDLTGSWTIESAAAKPIQRVKPERFLILQQAYGALALSRVKPECYGDSFATANCKIGNKPLVKAVLTFTGGWRIRPVEITHDREPRARIEDDTTWGFEQVPRESDKHLRLPAASPTARQLAGGLILEALDDAAVTFRAPQPNPGLLNQLASLHPQVCYLFADYPQRCAIVRFLNTMHALQFKDGDHVEVDFTQDLMYDLLETPPATRYLTFMRSDASPNIKDILYPGGGGSPFPRPCPPPTFAPPVYP